MVMPARTPNQPQTVRARKTHPVGHMLLSSLTTTEMNVHTPSNTTRESDWYEGMRPMPGASRTDLVQCVTVINQKRTVTLKKKVGEYPTCTCLHRWRRFRGCMQHTNTYLYHTNKVQTCIHHTTLHIHPYCSTVRYYQELSSD